MRAPNDRGLQPVERLDHRVGRPLFQLAYTEGGSAFRGQQYQAVALQVS